MNNERCSNLKNMRMLLASLTLALLPTFVGCNLGEGLPIHFVVPNGFRGEIRIIEDPGNGEILPKHGRWIICVLPATGILKVKSLKPFLAVHEETACYADGGVLNPGIDTNAIAFFGLGSFASGSTNGVSYFVGTQAEATAEASRF
jgi:hypothetical protein